MNDTIYSNLNMSSQPSEKNELVEYRLSKLEQQYTEVKNDIKGIMDVLNRLDKRFSTIPEGGFNYELYEKGLEKIQKQLENQQIIIDELQSFKWRAVGIIGVVMLVMQIFGTTIVEKVFRKETTAEIKPVKIELVMPSNISGGIVTNGVQDVRGTDGK